MTGPRWISIAIIGAVVLASEPAGASETEQASAAAATAVGKPAAGKPAAGKPDAGASGQRAAEERFRDGGAGEVPDFQRHVVPLLGRLGCNGRACHGSFQGRGGLSLSLFGHDFRADLNALTARSRSQPGQRIDRMRPAESLILRKATAAIDHEGGQRFEPGSWQYHLLARWIAAGAPGTVAPSVIRSLHVEPAQFDWNRVGDRGAVRVAAIWSDGSREDVTRLARFRVNDDSVASVDSDGAVTATALGDTALIVFYDNAVASVPIVVKSSAPPAAAWPAEPSAATKIDELVNARLRQLGIVPSPVCDDAEFLRRAAIDLTGTLPAPREVADFLRDPTADKRQRKIDELLRRPAMAAWWATKLCDFTGCNPQQQAELGQELAEQWYMWMYQRLRENTPYDQIVERMLLATGRTPGESYMEYAKQASAYFQEPRGADFSQRVTMPHFWSRRSLEKSSDKALAVAHSFLGIRLQCAECHKHPWDQWTKEDFQQFSRFFEDVKFGVTADAEAEYRQLAGRVGMRLKNDREGTAVNAEQLARAKTGETIPWREVYVQTRAEPVSWELLRSRPVRLEPRDDPRKPIMAWLREPTNPWFARAIVNRIWASCFHVGIVDPPDDLNPANPPSNPELLAWLAAEFARQEYDLRWLLREIALSRTWQRSSIPNAANLRDRRHFSHAIPRRLPAEVVYDGMKQVLCASDRQTEVREDLTRRAVGHLSMRMSGTYAMHVFGKPERAVACDCERVNEPSLLQAIFLQNDPLVHLMLAESGWLAELRREPPPDDRRLRAWIDEAWLRAYSRPPRDAERRRAETHLRSAESPAAGLEDLLWSLLNTKEFLLNH